MRNREGLLIRVSEAAANLAIRCEQALQEKDPDDDLPVIRNEEERRRLHALVKGARAIQLKTRGMYR